MRPLDAPIFDIRLRDIQIFLQLVKAGSVRELSRQMQISPSQISKSIASLEERLGHQLFHRSPDGVRISPEGVPILKALEKMARIQETLQGGTPNDNPSSLLSFSGTSFLNRHLLPHVFKLFRERTPDCRLRILDLPPSQFLPVGLRGDFQYCLHMNSLDWPKTWTSAQVGHAHWNLYGCAQHPLSERATEKKVLTFPFAYPVYWSPEGLRYGKDFAPVSLQKRIRGHETSTATNAAEILQHSEHLSFLPDLVARDYLHKKTLKKIQVTGWPKVTKPIYLTVKSDLVKQNKFLLLKTIFQETLRTFQDEMA